MSARKRSNDPGATTARGARRGRPPRREEHYRPAQPPTEERISHETATPHELYRHEKARRMRTAGASADPLADAKREYKALLAAEAARGKGGRPRKNAARPGPAAKRAASQATAADDEGHQVDEELEGQPGADDAEEGEGEEE